MRWREAVEIVLRAVRWLLMFLVSHFWCTCGYPEGDGLTSCGNCGLIRETTPEQDRKTADALARVILGGRIKTGK